MQQSPVEPQRFVERRALGAQPAEIRGMARVADDLCAAGAVRRRQHATTNAAIRAGRFRRHRGERRTGHVYEFRNHLGWREIAEHQFITQRANVGASTDHIEIGKRKSCVSDQDCADDAIIVYHEFHIDTHARVGIHDPLRRHVTREVSAENTFTPETLRFVATMLPA